MNVSKRIVVTALGLAGALAVGAAQARGNLDISVHIGSPGFVLGLPLPPLPYVVVKPSRGHSPGYGHGPVYDHAPVDRQLPVYRNPRGQVGYDRDRDGIPNRYDRVYNPRWDRDGDGVPNWRDGHRGDNRGERDRGQRDNRRGGRD